MPSFDVSQILRRTVSNRYFDLVTRRTGKAVRTGIEQDLVSTDHTEVAVIDFSRVRCLDFSCADEIVGKLLLEHGQIRYFLLRGVTDSHQVAIAQILERYALAVVAEDRGGRLVVLGQVSESARRAFGYVATEGAVQPETLAGDMDIPTDTAEHAIAELVQMRLAVPSPTDHRTVSLA